MTRVAVTGAITLIQVKSGANAALKLMEARISQSGSTTSTEIPIAILRKTAAATVTAFTPLLTSANDAAAQAVGGTTSTGTNASGEGTDGDILVQDVWNYLTQWIYQDPAETIEVIPAGFLALKLPIAPGSSITVTASLMFREVP